MKTNPMPKVTTIIPCFNREKLIRQTIESSLNQTYPNNEVVAVDDGCTDRTREILEEYLPKIKILEHPKRVNRGQSAAINLGIKSTKSEYIAILDSDDLWGSNKIELQVAFLEDNSDIGYVYANGFEIDGSGKILGTLFPDDYVAIGDPAYVLLKCPLGCPSGYLVRRSMYEKVGYFDESLRSAQDHDMAIRFAEISKVGYIKENLWYKREHLDSNSYSHAKRRWESGFVILQKACKRYPYASHVKRRRSAVLNFRLGQCYWTDKRYLKSLIYFSFAGMLDPKRGISILLNNVQIDSPH